MADQTDTRFPRPRALVSQDSTRADASTRIGWLPTLLRMLPSFLGLADRVMGSYRLLHDVWRVRYDSAARSELVGPARESVQGTLRSVVDVVFDLLETGRAGK